MYQPMGELNEAIALITKRGKSCKTYGMRLEKPDVTARSQRGVFHQGIICKEQRV